MFPKASQILHESSYAKFGLQKHGHKQSIHSHSKQWFCPLATQRRSIINFHCDQSIKEPQMEQRESFTWNISFRSSFRAVKGGGLCIIFNLPKPLCAINRGDGDKKHKCYKYGTGPSLVSEQLSCISDTYSNVFFW